MRTAHASFRASSRGPLSVRASAEAATKTVVRKSKAPPREGNVDGPFWIDETCINCDLCRRMGPSTFSQLGDGSVVYAQPTTKEQRVDALQALLSCPTNSIHADSFDKAELREAQQGMPRPIPNCPGVYHCGWHSEKSFSAASYFIQRPEGNILVDSPRWNPILLKKLEEMGGVSVMFLTHKDDMADHDKWAAHFKCPRIMHQRDLEGINPTIEVILQGDGPWDLNGKPIKESEIPTTSGNSNGGEAREITLIYTPGHTKGHVCLLYEPTKTLFSGDHLSQDGHHLDASPEGELHIFKDFNWFSVAKQFRSVEKLRRYDFMTVLPGHGRILQFRDAEHRARAFDDFLSNQDNQRSSM